MRLLCELCRLRHNYIDTASHRFDRKCQRCHPFSWELFISNSRHPIVVLSPTTDCHLYFRIITFYSRRQWNREWNIKMFQTFFKYKWDGIRIPTYVQKKSFITSYLKFIYTITASTCILEKVMYSVYSFLIAISSLIYLLKVASYQEYCFKTISVHRKLFPT